MTLGEEVDEDGDPPRIWSPDGPYPGTAFTRSIGDSVAESLGVVAEPEILAHYQVGRRWLGETRTQTKPVHAASDWRLTF